MSNQRCVLIGASVLTAALLAGSAMAQVAPRPAAAPAPAAAAAPVTPAPRIIVIDRNVIIRLSSAGKDMVTQTQALNRQAEGEFKSQADQLQKDAAALQQQLAIMAPEVKAQKQKEFTARQQSLESKMQARQVSIQNGFNAAGEQLDKALLPILQQILRDNGANMMLDRNAVIMSSLANIDITATAIERLDKALPHLTVKLGASTPATAPAVAVKR